MATATTATREQLLEQRVAELENTVAQLIRATSAATHRLGSNAGFSARQANEWWTWQQLGAGHEDITGLYDHLQRSAAARQD